MAHASGSKTRRRFGAMASAASVPSAWGGNTCNWMVVKPPAALSATLWPFAELVQRNWSTLVIVSIVAVIWQIFLVVLEVLRSVWHSWDYIQ